MRDRPVILAGLVGFLLVATFPVWYNVAAGTTAAAPVLARAVSPSGFPANAGQCVAPVEDMRASHMVLLRTWREEVVRTGRRAYTTPDGRQYAKSLTGTCLACHARKTEFCDRCHDYAGVTPVCMDCHVDPDARRAAR
jgi:hypothetical protein